MITHKTENGSEQTNASSFLQRRCHSAVLRPISRTLLHARALIRLAHRRPALALGLAVASGSAISTLGAAVSVGVIHGVHRSSLANVVPLAPAPAPPAPPVDIATEHHNRRLLSLPKLPLNPLHGLASWYGSMWNGRKTASGETYDDTKLTAAHKSLPLGTLVRVTNLASKRSVVVRINDRGALTPNRIIDLSSAAAREIGVLDQGLARVKLEVLGRI